jgi:hypothetical protein
VFNRDCRLIGIYNQLEYVLVNYFDLKWREVRWQ